MKEIRSFAKKILAFAAMFFLAAGAFAFAFGGMQKGYAETVATPLTVLDAWKVVGWWGNTSVYDNIGAKTTIVGGTDGNAWNYGAKINWDGTLNSSFDVSAGQTVDIKFKLGLADVDASSVNGPQFDIIINSGTAEIIRIRVFFKEGGIDNGSHPVDLYKNGSWDSYTTDIWMKGDASLLSEFHLAFNKENLVMADFNNNGEMRPLDASGKLKEDLADILPTLENINIDIKGDAGFDKNVDVIVTEINGQSLANDGTNFSEDERPSIFAGTPIAATVDKAYTLPVYASDLFTSSENIKYHVDFGSAAAGDYTYNDSEKSIIFHKAGTYELAVTAEDGAGNLSEPVNLTVKALSEIAPPVIGDLPVIEDINTEKGAALNFSAPEVTEETGEYTLSMLIFDASGEEELYRILLNAVTGKFEFKVPYSLESGEYNIIYVAENDGGTTESAATAVNITVSPFAASDLITGAGFATNADNAPLVDITDSGVRIRTDMNWGRFSLGKDMRFDARQGREIVFTVPKTTGGKVNSLMGGRIDFIIYNPVRYDAETSLSGSLDENGNIVENYAILGVWGGTDDRPTNIYIKTEAFGASPKDITDTGWIKSNETETSISFRMRFDADSYFSAERTGGMTQAVCEKDANIVQESLDSLFEIWNTNILAAGLSIGSLADAQAFEITVNSVDGAVLTEPADAVIVSSNIPEIVQVETTVKIDLYGFDFFGGNKMSLVIVSPDGEETFVSDADGYSFCGTELGKYTLTYSLTGANEVEVKKEFTVYVKDVYEVLVPEIDGTYNSTFEIGDDLIILPLKANDKIASYTIKIVKPDGSETEVVAGAVEKMTMSGIYTLRYTVLDKAKPEPTSFIKECVLNVIDTVKPIVSVGETAEKVAVGEDVVLGEISVTEDSNYVIIVKVVTPDGTEQTLTADADGRYSFKAETKGEYKVTITVTDDYDNSESVSLTVNAEGGGCSCGSALNADVMLSSVVFLAAGVCLLIIRRKRKN